MREPRVIVLVGVLLALATLPYTNALSAGFTLDDEAVIRKNAVVTDGIDPIGALATPVSPGDLYRPLTVLTFAINEALTPGAALPYHLVNLVMHTLVTLLVFVAARRLFESARLAFVAASLFAVHPIHTEAVTSVVGRAELLAALFGLVAMLAAERVDSAGGRTRRVLLQATSIGAFVLAVLSKESALTVVALMPLFRIACRREPLGAGLRRELYSLDWVPYAACAAVFFTARLCVLGTVTPYTVRPLENVLAFVPWTARVPSALGVLWDYFGLLNVPLVLAADYSYGQVGVVSWWHPRALGGLALVVLAAGTLVRHRQPAVGFAAVFPLLALALTANVFFPIGTIKAERLLYLPSVGYVLLMAYAIDRLLAVERYRVVATAAVVGVLVAFGARVWDRNRDWQDNTTLGHSMAWTAPDSAKSRYNFGAVLQDVDNAAAAREFHRALELYPAMEDAAIGIGLVHEKRGAVDAALAWYRRALEIAPACGQAHTNVCRLLLKTNQFEAAVAACRRGLRYHPADANLLAGLGHGLVGAGLRDEGLAVFQRSLALNSDNPSLRTYLARLGTGQGENAVRDEVVTLQ